MHHSPKVCIIGSGPCGMYLSARLLKKVGNIAITILEKEFAPFGLVRAGVAPDNTPIKELQEKFTRTLSDERVVYYGGANIDLTDIYGVKSLKKFFHKIILCTGTSIDRPQAFTGKNVFSASQIYRSYNSKASFDNTHKDPVRSISIFGHGNVALDIARVFASPSASLYFTEIDSRFYTRFITNSPPVLEISIIGRSGPSEISFTISELRSLFSLPNITFFASDHLWNVALDTLECSKSRMLKLMQERCIPLSLRKQVNARAIIFYFDTRFLSAQYDSANAVKSVVSNGYDDSSMSIIGDIFVFAYGLSADHNLKRLYEAEENFYLAGWAKSGSKGNISTTMFDAFSLADSLAIELNNSATQKENFIPLSEYKDKMTVLSILEAECIEGESVGKYRIKRL